MQVILTENVESLGQVGDVVAVKSGYARNFLLPQKKAVFANSENLKTLESQREQIAVQQAEIIKVAEAKAKTIEALTVTVEKSVGEEGKLYGSVTVSEILENLVAQKVDVEKRQIYLGEPIRDIGEHAVQVKVHPLVVAKLKVVVVAKDAE